MSDFDRLRHLLLTEEREKRALAEQRIDELERVNSELAALLPGLVTAAPSEPMSRALATPVAAALGNAVHRNRASIVDALFPVIGPIIRKAIAEALRNLMRDLNQVLEHGFSPRGIRWRLEAWRSGVPFAQIVLKHSLRYRLDHVFLIERDSGLVLHRESSPGLPDLDADAIAGMLTAIGQFVRDSVGRDGGDSLEAARVGEHLLWVLDGPRASLACFIQGVPPDSLRAVLSDRLEQIHSELSQTRESPTDGATPTEPDLGASLDPVDLVAASAALAGDEGTERARPSRWPMLLVVLLILCALGWHFVHVARWNERVDGLRSGLTAHPGFLLTGIESKPWSRLTVHGLIDADAEPLQALLGRTDFGEVTPTLDLEGYLSTDDAILLRRATRLLDPPASVQLAVSGGVLTVSGEAAGDWIERRREQAAWVAGIRSVDWQARETGGSAQADAAVAAAAAAAAATAAARAELIAVAGELQSHVVTFESETRLAEGAELQLRRIADSLQRATSLAGQAGVGLRLRIDGYSDVPGSAGLNANLRLARAGWLRDRLREQGVAADLLDASTLFTNTDSSAGIRGAKVRLETGEPAR
jgi:outer membrane protein OmpA-like peptidoglycan-associated protein